MAKILFIQPAFAHYRRELFDLLHKNHDITFLFIRKRQTYPSQRGPAEEWKKVFLSGEERDKYWILGLIKTIIKEKPEAIITSINRSQQTIVSVIMGKILNIPVILWSLNWEGRFFPEHRHIWKVIASRILIRQVTRRVDALVVSGTIARRYNEKMALPRTPVFVAFQSSQDLSLMVRNDDSGLNELFPPNSIKILFFSRIIKLKGLDLLIKAFASLEKKYKTAYLLVAGDGPYREECEALAEELKVCNIKFFGAVDSENAWRYYKMADIFVLPNGGEEGKDGWGLVINEAAGMSLPIVTTDAVGAAYDMVKDGLNGYIVRAGDVVQLRYALEKMLEDGAMREQMGAESRKIFEEKNSYLKMYEGFNDAVNRVLEKN